MESSQKFKIGDMVMFVKDIKSGYERNHILLIPAYLPCKILKLSKHTIILQVKNCTEKLRYIPTRMRHATELGRAMYE